jgi:hypothetical protein
MTGPGGWVTTAVRGLSKPAVLLLQTVCWMEDADRVRWVLDSNWERVWRQLGQDGEPPELDGLVAELDRAALLSVEAQAQADDVSGGLAMLRTRPEVVKAVRDGTPVAVWAAVHAELAAFWRYVSSQALAAGRGELGELVVRAALAGAPYLFRLRAWDDAGVLLERAYVRGGEDPGVAQAVLPLLARVADATDAPKHLRIYGRVLHRVDPTAAEEILRQALNGAVGDGDFRLAAATSWDLVYSLRDQGRLWEALAAAETAAGHSRRAGLSLWTHAGDEAQRLQILRRLGEAERMLADADRLLADFDTLPETSDPDDPAIPWNVREIVLQLASSAAVDLRQWESALDYTARLRASMRRRGANASEVAKSLFGDYRPLLELGRWAEAEALLAECRRVFTHAGDAAALDKVFAAQADLAARRALPPDAPDAPEAPDAG